MQAFFAQLFSHVGLWALVIGYSVMGAFVFSYLEKPYEKLTRLEVGNNRGKTLDELYGITGQTTPPSNYLHFMLSYSLVRRLHRLQNLLQANGAEGCTSVGAFILARQYNNFSVIIYFKHDYFSHNNDVYLVLMRPKS